MYKTGRCCAGNLCKTPNAQLREIHKCMKCKEIVHILCSKHSLSANGDDQHLCMKCENENQATQATEKNSNIVALSRKSSNKNKEMKCKKCGGTDHLNARSKKCSAFKGRQRKKKEPQDSPVQNTAEASVQAASEENANKNNATSSDNTDDLSGQDANGNTTSGVSTSSGASPIRKPNFVKLGSGYENYRTVLDISSFTPIETKFKLEVPTNYGRKMEVLPTAENLCEKYWSPETVESIVENSNKYRSARLQKEPDLVLWKNEKVSAPFTLSCTYQFLAILYYIGIVRLPDKTDYWRTDPAWPTHAHVHELGMTRDRFVFMWRHFHVNTSSGDESDHVVDEEDENEFNLVVQEEERVQHNQDEEEHETETTTNNNNTQDIPDANEREVWYEKLKPLINHVRDVSLDLIFVLGTLLCIDEMMIRFLGRSYETHRMKNKPISQGYKWFVLATKAGFVVNFTPDGRHAQKNNTQEFEMRAGSGKIEQMILYLTEVLDQLREKQKNRIQSNYYSRSTRSNVTEQYVEEPMDKFCIAMDNYFTLPTVIKSLREMNIGVVGTARNKRTWPPKALKDVDVEKAEFNDFYYLVDEYGTLVSRWMDNNMVLCVSTVHKAGQVVKRVRRRPRYTVTNKSHVDKIWGNCGTKEIYIPTVIDDYNHWMGGVDVADQRIAYYHPDIRCRRNWIPMFMQIMSMIRSNAYIVYKDYHKDDSMSQKDFLMEMIKALMAKARHHHNTHRGMNNEFARATNRGIKRGENSATDLFPKRHHLPFSKHFCVTYEGNKGSCIVCTDKFNTKKKRRSMSNYNVPHNMSWQKECKRVKSICSYCSTPQLTCFLCNKHFDEFHGVVRV